jgi:hypothetical protein
MVTDCRPGFVGARWLTPWPPHLCDEIADIDPQNLGDLEDLDEVEPPLPAFVLGYERLW